MIDIFPAVDILGGCCVRLAKGDYETVSVYDENPERAAERFLQAGIRRLHVVDLDAAKAGHPVIRRLSPILSPPPPMPEQACKWAAGCVTWLQWNKCSASALLM